MIYIPKQCLEYFRACVGHAKEVGAWESLRDILRRKSRADEPGTFLLELFRDFAPHSFAFWYYKCPNGKRSPVREFWYNGGILFYAGAESGVSGQFSVTNSGLTHARYECHT